jgi:hypothetical protein
MNAELASLYAADREDHAIPRMAGTADYTALRNRDANRRSRAHAILAGDAASDPLDWYHAAWLFNHGDTPEEAEAAHRWAARAAEAGCRPARWLAAAALDRWHMYRGLAQRFGTQIVPDGVGYRVWDTEPGVTDDERACHDVPPLAEQLARAAEDSRSLPQPPMDLAPTWL